MGELEATLGLHDAGAPDLRGEPPQTLDEGPPSDGETRTLDVPVPDAGPPAFGDAETRDARASDRGDLDLGPTPDGTVEPVPDAGPPPAPEGPAVYRGGRDVSPITPWVADNLREIAARNPGAAEDVFAKVGDSSTVSRSFLVCFAGDRVQLDGRDALGGTIDWFGGGDAAGGDPYTRESLAATVGWSATNVLAGDPSALDRELNALNPRFASVMYGTNDIQRRDIDRYGASMLDVVDQLVARGVIPVVSSSMPRDDSADADREVPGYNGVARAVAQSRQIPFVDLHRRLLPLPDHGLGPDNLHCSAWPSGACGFTQAGLQYGYNWRNLLTISAFHGAREALAGRPPDPPEPLAMGAGTPEDPIVVPGLPYGDVRDSGDGPRSDLDLYPGCDAPQNEAGPEWVYRLDLDHPANVRAIVVDRGQVDVDVHLVADPTDPGSCLLRAHTDFRASLEPGSWYFVLDTWVGQDGPRSGEYLFALVEEPD